MIGLWLIGVFTLLVIVIFLYFDKNECSFSLGRPIGQESLILMIYTKDSTKVAEAYELGSIVGRE